MIHIQSQADFANTSLLGRAARLVLETSEVPRTDLPSSAVDSDLTIVLTDDEQLQQMNRDYLGQDMPTDVLSFPAFESDPETGRPYLGDILISIPRAKAQAGAAGHSLEAELQLLVVHGTLHLLGHDHAQTQDRDRMWSAQGEVLSRLGLSHIQIRDTE